MHVMFVHPVFPAQFGQLATYLATQLKWPCTFVTAGDTRGLNLPFRQINYRVSEEGLPPGYHSLATLPGLIRHMDGIDTEFFQPRPVPRPVTFRGLSIGKDTRVVTYASPGLESMRGFDIFMKAANLILKEIDNVIFLIAGGERSYYGHELNYLPEGT